MGFEKLVKHLFEERATAPRDASHRCASTQPPIVGRIPSLKKITTPLLKIPRTDTRKDKP